MRTLVPWQQRHAGACDQPFRNCATNDPSYASIHVQFLPMADQVLAIKARCAHHPGFLDAYAAGVWLPLRRND